MGLHVDTLNIALGFSRDIRREIQATILDDLPGTATWRMHPSRDYHLTMLSAPRPEKRVRGRVHSVVRELVAQHVDCLSSATIVLQKMVMTKEKLLFCCTLSEELRAFQRLLRETVKREVGEWQIFPLRSSPHISVASQRAAKPLCGGILLGSEKVVCPDRLAITKRVIDNEKIFFQVKEVFRFEASQELSIPA